MTKSISLVLLLCWAPALVAQTSGTIRGTVIDSATGTPAFGVHVGIKKIMGRIRTDSAGKYVFGRVSPGIRDIEFFCPSRTMRGRKLTNRQVVVEPNGETILDVRVPSGSCFEPDSTSRTGIYQGYYTYGFEESRFTICRDSTKGSQEEKLLPNRYGIWVSFSEAASKQNVDWPPIDSAGQTLYPRYFVRWRGTLTGPGRYGHMGVSGFEFVVDSILEVRIPKPKDCP